MNNDKLIMKKANNLNKNENIFDEKISEISSFKNDTNTSFNFEFFDESNSYSFLYKNNSENNYNIPKKFIMENGDIYYGIMNSKGKQGKGVYQFSNKNYIKGLWSNNSLINIYFYKKFDK